MTTADYSKFTSQKVGAKIKQNSLVDECEIADLVKTLIFKKCRH